MGITNALVWGIVLFLTLIPFQANAESPRPAYPAEDSCQTPLSLTPGNWSEQERWVWDKRICLGKIADLSKRPRGENNACDLGKTEEWSQDRHISSQFIQTVLFHAPFRRAYIQSGFRLRCAIFPQKVDLSQGHFTREIWLDNSYFAQGLNASDLEIEGLFSLEGSRFQGPFKVELNDAKVGGQLNASGSTFQGLFIAYGLTVQNDLFLSKDTGCEETECKETTFSKEVNLLGATVGGQLNASGSTFQGPFIAYGLKVGGLLNASGSEFEGLFDAESLEVKQNLFLSRSEFREINITGATVGGQLNASGATFQGPFIAYGLKVGGPLDASGSTFEGLFDAESLEVKQNLFLSRSEFREINIAGAKVGGLLNAAGSVFEGLFDAKSLEVKQNLFLRQSEFGEINLVAAKVEGQLDAVGSEFQGLFDAESLEVKRDLFLSRSEFGEINLAGGKVGGDLKIIGSEFEGLFNAESLEVKRDLFLRGGARFQAVNLAEVKIGGDFQLQGGIFAGKLDLTGAEINGELHLHQQGENPTWEIEKGGQPRLILRNASVGALNDSKDSWKNLDGRLELTGFTYKQMGGVQGKAGETMADRPAEYLLAWLGMQPDFKTVYQPQPFQQLANTLQAAGHENKANDIIVSAKNHRLSLPGTPQRIKVSLFLQKYLFNYGYDLIRPIWILLALLAAGTLFFLFAYQLPESIKHTSPRQKMKYLIKHRLRQGKRIRQSMGYSLDQAIPLLSLKESHKQIDLTGYLQGYFYFHQIASFVLLSFFIAGLTGLVQG